MTLFSCSLESVPNCNLPRILSVHALMHCTCMLWSEHVLVQSKGERSNRTPVRSRIRQVAYCNLRRWDIVFSTNDLNSTCRIIHCRVRMDWNSVLGSGLYMWHAALACMRRVEYYCGMSARRWYIDLTLTWRNAYNMARDVQSYLAKKKAEAPSPDVCQIWVDLEDLHSKR